jgi:hypothetical protein
LKDIAVRTPPPSPVVVRNPPKPVKKRGRKKATGRFETREELCEAVWCDYKMHDRKIYDIATAYRVSTSIVQIILNNREGYPDYLKTNDPARGGVKV